MQNICDDSCIKHNSDFSCRAMQGLRFSSINYLRWGGIKETGSQMKVCAIYNIRFTRINYLWLGNTKETVSQIKVCAIYGMQFTRMNCSCWDMRAEMVQMNKMCVKRGKHVCNRKRVRRPITTQTITANKPCVLWANDCSYTIVSDWWKHHRRVPLFSPCAMWFSLSAQHLRSVYSINIYTSKDNIS